MSTFCGEVLKSSDAFQLRDVWAIRTAFGTDLVARAVLRD
jgi:hypothetical protein